MDRNIMQKWIVSWDLWPTTEQRRADSVTSTTVAKKQRTHVYRSRLSLKLRRRSKYLKPSLNDIKGDRDLNSGLKVSKRFLMFLSWWTIGYFRVAVCPCQNESSCETIHVKMLSDYFHINEADLHMKGFATWGLVLKLRHKETRKWPINVPLTF